MSNAIKILLGAIGGAVLTLVIVAVFTGGGMMGGMGQMTGHGMMGGGVLGMLLVMLFWVAAVALLITLVVALVVWIVRQSQRR